jgi:2'-5' RNA ligase
MIVRTFIAIELPKTIQATLAQLQKTLIAQLHNRGPVARVRWADRAKTHLTLRFLGETSQEQAANLQAPLKTICRANPIFSLRLTELGCFPNCSRPRVIWIGVGGDASELLALQGSVEKVVQQTGFEAETRAFSPHITLGRVHQRASADDVRGLGYALQEIIGNEEADRFISTVGEVQGFAVEEITHMRSVLQPSGSRYTSICRFRLNDA